MSKSVPLIAQRHFLFRASNIWIMFHAIVLGEQRRTPRSLSTNAFRAYDGSHRSVVALVMLIANLEVRYLSN